MKLLANLICILVLVTVAVSSISGTEIKSTALLFRHGERTPLFEIGTLKNAAIADIGYGQLTRTGSRQSYLNGLFLRARYGHLLPKDGLFRDSNMRVLSSPPERCVMSVQSFMTGLIPPPVYDTTLPLMWQPFAMAVDTDGEIIYFDSKSCPKFEESFENLTTTNPPADVQKWLIEDKPILDQLSGKIGIPLNKFQTLIGIADIIRSNIAMQDQETPRWAIDAYYATLEKYLARFLDVAHETEVMLKIRGGPLITEIVRNMEAKAANETNGEGKNFQIYSSHDLTILSLGRVLNVTAQIPQLPSHADTIMIELVDNEGGQEELQVQTIYVDNSKAIPNLYALHVPGCGVQCSLTRFRQLVAPYLVDNLEDLCKI